MKNDGFTPMTTENVRKRYSNGYLACLEKNGKSGGKILVVMGAIMAAIGVILGYALVRLSMEVQSGGSNGIDGMIFLGIVCLVFFALSVLLIRFGRKRKGMDAEDWLQTMIDASDYPESIIQEFSLQVPQQDSFYFDILGETPSCGILTRDYIFFENGQFCVIKRSDISGVYLVNMTDVGGVGNKIKTVYHLHVAIFSNHNTCTMIRASQKRAQQLIAMLTEKHPQIDTAGGRVISDKKYDKMRASLSKSM